MSLHAAWSEHKREKWAHGANKVDIDFHNQDEDTTPHKLWAQSGKNPVCFLMPGCLNQKAVVYMSPLNMKSASFRAVLSIATTLTALLAFFSLSKFHLLKQCRIRISLYNVLTLQRFKESFFHFVAILFTADIRYCTPIFPVRWWLRFSYISP